MNLKHKLGNFIVQASVYAHPKERWIWARIHKSASTTLYDGFFRSNSPELLLPANHKQLWLDWYDNVTEEELKEYFLWTFVRNPYDRFCSMAGMFCYTPDEFARRFFELRSKDNKIWRHTNPQHQYTHHTGECFMNFIGKVENLQEDFEKLCSHLGYKPKQLPTLNSSNKKGALTDYAKKFVQDHFSEDFEYFDYEKDI